MDPPRPSGPTIRYRPARTVPGANRSPGKDPDAALQPVRDVEPGERLERGEPAGPAPSPRKVRVGLTEGESMGLPQAAQNRLFSCTGAEHRGQVTVSFLLGARPTAGGAKGPRLQALLFPPPSCDTVLP